MDHPKLFQMLGDQTQSQEDTERIVIDYIASTSESNKKSLIPRLIQYRVPGAFAYIVNQPDMSKYINRQHIMRAVQENQPEILNILLDFCINKCMVTFDFAKELIYSALGMDSYRIIGLVQEKLCKRFLDSTHQFNTWVLNCFSDCLSHRANDPEGTKSLVLGWNQAKKLGTKEGVDMLRILDVERKVTFPSLKEQAIALKPGINTRKITVKEEDIPKIYENLEKLFEAETSVDRALGK